MVDLQQLQQNKEIIRVSISEAARLFGVNPQTIRRAIKANEITYVVVANRYKINPCRKINRVGWVYNLYKSMIYCSHTFM